MFINFLYITALIIFTGALISTSISAITTVQHFQLNVYAWCFILYAGILEIQQLLKDQK